MGINNFKHVAHETEEAAPPEPHEPITTSNLSASTASACTFCGDEFPSRSALFRHLRRPSEHCSAPRDDEGEKVLLLVGYDTIAMENGGTSPSSGTPQITQSKPLSPDDGEEHAATVLEEGGSGGDAAVGLIVQAMGIVAAKHREGLDSFSSCSRRAFGYSQASGTGSRRCPLLEQEVEVSASADTVCIRAPSTIPLKGVRAWLAEVNGVLDGTGVRILGRMPVPREFHAEVHAKRRRYEYLVPAWLLDQTADVPWTGPPRCRDDGKENLVPLLQNLKRKGLMPFGHCNGDHDGRRRQRPLWHNFSAKAVPHSPSAGRRLYRFHACGTLQLRGADYICLSVNGDAFVDRQVRGMVGLAIAGARGLVSCEVIASCIDPTRQEDLLPVPLAPVAPCFLAEVGYPTWQSKLGSVCMSPGADSRAAPPLEGWSDEQARSDAAGFRSRVLDSAAGWWEARQMGREWLHDVLEPGALKLRDELAAAKERSTAFKNNGRFLPATDLRDSSGETCSRSDVPSVYASVLRLLREADASGNWPDSSLARSLVISEATGQSSAADDAASKGKEYTPEGKGRCSIRRKHRQEREARAEGEGPGGHAAREEAAEAAIASASAPTLAGSVTTNVVTENGDVPRRQQQLDECRKDEEEKQQSRGGSFTVGAFPPPCLPPRSNKTFPELARAAFELEGALMPDRPPSTTIAINRHAKFKPHVDSGAGAGQSTSLIVGLGDYSRGELVVEGMEVDIRYRPLEFNGWTQRHWTRPFEGERYSLVWFTPKGCEGISGDARFCVAEDRRVGCPPSSGEIGEHHMSPGRSDAVRE